MQQLFAGIDGGQSSTTAIIADQHGEILGRGAGGPADEVGQGPTSTRLREALEHALYRALNSANIARDTQFESVVAGVSGYEGSIIGNAPNFNARHTRILHDAPIAHAGALDGKPGILVIAGTGSVAYGVNDRGDKVTIGGWGYLFGDEGSAFWIARAALKQTLRADDLGFSDFQQFITAFHAGEITRDRIAAFAQTVLERAEQGDERFRKITKAAANELAQLATACAKHLTFESAEVAFAGGLLKSDWFSQTIDAAIAGTSMQRVQPKHEPALGALLLAYREINITPVPRLRAHGAPLGMTC